MLENGKISVRQFTILVIFITIGDSVLVLTPIATSFAKQDAWISCIVGVLLGIAAIYIFSSVGRLYPQLTLVQTIQKIFGKWLGSCLSFLFLLYPLITLSAFIKEIGDFMTTEMMPGTPEPAIQILFISVIVLAVRLGIEVIARTGELFLPLIFLLFSVLIIFLIPQGDFDKLKPVLENGIKPVLHGAIPFTAFTFMEMIIMLMIFPSVNKQKKIRKGMIQGSLIGSFVLILIIIISILVLGVDTTSRSLYPSYSLARRISVGNFIERVEAIVALIWLLTIFVKSAVYFYSLNLGVSQLLNLKGYRMLTLPMGMLLFAMSGLMSPNITYYNAVLFKYWPYLDFSYGLLLPLLILMVYHTRKKLTGLNKT